MPATAVSALFRMCSQSIRGADATDADLLRRVAEGRDADALGELVRRHSGLVWGVCRRRLKNETDCEDAFQATFLALVQQIKRLDAQRPLAGWLHTVADRVARKAWARSLKRAAAERSTQRPPSSDATSEVGSGELMAIVDAEIARLPLLQQDAVVLCCVQGLTRDEAAEAIGCSVTALKARLERGRTLLRQRLERRGIPLPAAFIALGLGTTSASAAMRGKAVAAALGSPSTSVAGLAAAAVSVPWIIGPALVAVAAIGLCVFGFTLQVPPAAPPAKDTPPPNVAKEVEARPRTDLLGDPLPEAALLRLGTARFRHPGIAKAIVLTADEKTVLTLGTEGLFAWETATGKELWRDNKSDLKKYQNVAVGETPLAIFPDGKHAVMTTGDSSFHLWDIATGKREIREIDSGTGERDRAHFTSVDVSKDGKTLALGWSKGVVLCDLAGKVVAKIANNPAGRAKPNEDRLLAWDDYCYPRFAPDGKSLAIAMSDAPESVRICNTDGGEERRISLTKRYLDSAFSPNGSLLAVAERDDTVRVYETDTGKRKYEWKVTITRATANENYIFKVAFAPDGKTVVAAASDKLLHIWDVATGKKVGELEGHGWYPRGLAFTADSKTLYSTGWDGDIRRWSMAERKQLPLPQGVRGSASVAAAPDGKSVAYADGSGNIRLVDAKTGEEKQTLSAAGISPGQMTFSPNSRSIAVGGSAGNKVAVAIVDVTTGKVSRRWEWPKGRNPHATVEDLKFSADGKKLAEMTFSHHAARVWDLTADGEPIVVKHQEGYGLAFSPDGKTLLTGGWDKKLRFWDTATGKQNKEFPVVLSNPVANDPSGVFNDVRVFAVDWSADGTRIAATDLGMRLWIWDADTMKVRAVTDTKDIPRHNALTFSPDGQWLATGGASGKVKVWDAWSGQLVWDRGVHRADLYKVSFGHDSRTILSGASDGLGYLWDLRPKIVPFEKPADLWQAFTGADGPTAYQAFWGLLDQPEATVAVVARNSAKYLAAVDAAQIGKWIDGLDSAKFATREAASSALSANLRAAIPHIRAQLGKDPSAEQRERLQKLADEWELSRRGWSRAVTLLAHIGTPAARNLLGQWAAADKDGDLGRAASAALGRTP